VALWPKISAVYMEANNNDNDNINNNNAKCGKLTDRLIEI